MSILKYENQRLLEVVDENDKVVDLVSRAEVHLAGQLHREVHVWMIDQNNNIIFQIRGLNRDNAGLLDATVGGHVERGESYLDAAIRETKEETGFIVSPSDLVFLKKIRGSEISQDPWGLKNNFLREIYLYKPAIDYKKIKKEEGIPGGGFQKILAEFLIAPHNEFVEAIIPFVFKEELPILFKYIK